MNVAEKNPTEKRRSGCGCLLTGVAVVFVVLVLSFVIWRMQASRRVAAEVARLRTAGQPTTPMELAEYYETPNEDEDTTQLWLDGMLPLTTQEFMAKVAKLPIVGNSESKHPALNQDWPELAAVRQLLVEHQYSLDKFHTAAAKGGRARYAVKFQDGIGALLPHAQNQRGAARMLKLEAFVRARDGDAHGAAEAIHAIFMAARSLEHEPLLISQLVRIAIHGMAIGLIEELLPQVEFLDEDLRRLQADLRAADWRDGLQRGLAGERSTGLLTFRNPSTLDPDMRQVGWVANNDDLLLYLRLHQQLIDAANEPWPQALQQVEQVDQQIKKIVGSPLGRVRHIFTALMMPAANAAFQAGARIDASSQAADAAIAVELFRRKHGKLPTKLDELVPEFLPQLPLDPFDGQPLRFLVRDDEYVIYSIGADRVDNGGQKQPNPNDEIIFTVKRPSSPPRQAAE